MLPLHSPTEHLRRAHDFLGLLTFLPQPFGTRLLVAHWSNAPCTVVRKTHSAMHEPSARDEKRAEAYSWSEAEWSEAEAGWTYEVADCDAGSRFATTWTANAKTTRGEESTGWKSVTVELAHQVTTRTRHAATAAELSGDRQMTRLDGALTEVSGIRPMAASTTRHTAHVSRTVCSLSEEHGVVLPTTEA